MKAIKKVTKKKVKKIEKPVEKVEEIKPIEKSFAITLKKENGLILPILLEIENKVVVKEHILGGADGIVFATSKAVTELHKVLGHL